MSERSIKTPSQVDRSRHLAALHEGWVTPPPLLAAVVREVTTAPILDIQRIIGGEGNEVYDVTVYRSSSLIVKIAHERPESHDREAWVLRQCQARGIRAPRVHLHRSLQVGRRRRSVIVMDKLDGDRLCDVELHKTDLRRVLGQIGEWLRELHTIPVRGLGYVDGSGIGKVATMEDWLAGFVEEARGFEDAGLSVGIEVERSVAGCVR